MNFLNQPLVWGAAAFAIPLILHILNRSRYRRVEWGAMHLLESVIKVNHKRFRIEQLILLLVRCAIPALLAFCLARPVLTGDGTLAGDAPVSLVILLDNSYSMETQQPGGTRFDAAVNSARDILNAVGQGSDVAIIQTGGAATPVFDRPVFDLAAVDRRLQMLTPGFGSSRMADALKLGLEQLAEMSHVRRELVVISDFQNGDWKDSASAQDDVRRVINEQLADVSVRPEITLLQIGEPVTNNVSIESLDYSLRPLGVGQQLLVRANLRNHGPQSMKNVRVRLLLDDEEQTVSQLELDANSTGQVLFPVEFNAVGSHVVDVQADVDDVQADVDDVLSTDNAFAAAFSVLDSIPVLLVDGAPSSEPLQGETDFLSVALSPFTLGRVKLADLVTTQTVTVDKFKSDALNEFRVVILANVSKLQDKQVTALKDFVSMGGALCVFSGGTIDAKWYNEKLGTDAFLPARFGAPRGKISADGQATRIVAKHFDHPALQFFNERANGDLSSAEIRQWFELQPVERNGTAPAVVAHLETGEPLILEHAVGDGFVMQVATTCDADWSDLPMRPFFVPLMQQLVTTLATRLTPARNIETGEPAVLMLPKVAADDVEKQPTKAVAQPAVMVSVTTPVGLRQNVETQTEGRQQVARFVSTQRPGTYTMSTPDAQTVHFVAATGRQESTPGLLPTDELHRLAENISARTVKDAQEYLEQDDLRRHGREIWRYVLMALLAFLFLELLLQQRFARVS